MGPAITTIPKASRRIGGLESYEWFPAECNVASRRIGGLENLVEFDSLIVGASRRIGGYDNQ